MGHAVSKIGAGANQRKSLALVYSREEEAGGLPGSKRGVSVLDTLAPPSPTLS